MSAVATIPTPSALSELFALAEHLVQTPAPWVVVEAPVVELKDLLAACEAPSVAWLPEHDDHIVGFGSSYVLGAYGPQRFAEIEKAGHEILSRLSAQQPLYAPKFFGSFAFAEGFSDAAWQDFGDAHFVLPTWLYIIKGSRAYLAMTAPATGQARPFWSSKHHEPVPRHISSQCDRAAYEAQVSQALTAIRQQQFGKVVVARAHEHGFSSDVQASRVLVVLSEGGQGCTRFLLQAHNTTFLGATPERLLRLSGVEAITEAIAGSMSPSAAQATLASKKEQAEHRFVVDHIESVLAPLCDAVKVAATPNIQKLSNVWHLRTPISARLKERQHVLSLVERLHPTPAVGGTPRKEAMAFIGQHETTPRGHYTGPVGWFNAQGDGEFFVGLRCALVKGATVRTYAGAGIVQGSDPSSEFQETLLKERTLARALGITA